MPEEPHQVEPHRGEPRVELGLSLAEAEVLHGALEDLLERRGAAPDLELLYRRLGWRLLAAREGSGLTATLAELARRSATLEQFEAARDEELGPILDGLERGENRDP